MSEEREPVFYMKNLTDWWVLQFNKGGTHSYTDSYSNNILEIVDTTTAPALYVVSQLWDKNRKLKISCTDSGRFHSFDQNILSFKNILL